MTKDERVRLDKLIADVGEIKGYLDKVKQHDKILHGNGQPGLCDRVTKIEESRKTLLVMWTVVNGLIGMVCGLLAAWAAIR